MLRTYKAQADSVLVDSLITVTDGSEVVFKAEVDEEGTITFVATQYGIDTYGFADGQLEIESYKIIFDKSGADAEAARGVAMHVAAMAPAALDEASIPQATKDSEREIAIEKTKKEEVDRAVEQAIRKAGINPNSIK